MPSWQEKEVTNMKKSILSMVAAVVIAVLGFFLAEPTNNAITYTSDGNMHVYYLDVGQADSMFIVLPDGENILIDAGNKENGNQITNTIRNMGFDKIDTLIATHPHADHIGGMETVVRSFDIGKIYMTNAVSNTSTYKKLLLAIKEKEYKITTAKAGVGILQNENVTAEFIAPVVDEYDDINDYSAMVKLVHGENVFVFTGDGEKKAEDLIRANIKCDVLKVGHHGSDTSTSKNFLKKTEPEYAIISCGTDNDYGHPHSKVLDRLEERGIEIFRTDIHGTIEAVSDGVNITFNTEKE